MKTHSPTCPDPQSDGSHHELAPAEGGHGATGLVPSAGLAHRLRHSRRGRRRPPFAEVFDVVSLLQSRPVTEDDILQLCLDKFAWQTAGNVDRLAELIADDLVLVHVNGRMATKAQWLNALRTGAVRYGEIAPREMSAHLHGDTAVVVGRAEIDVISGDKEAVYDLTFTEVYVRRNGDWKLVNLHASAS